MKKTRTVSVRVTPEFYNRIQSMAKLERRTTSNLALLLIENGFRSLGHETDFQTPDAALGQRDVREPAGARAD